MTKRREDAETRSCTEVGPGDYVNVRGRWHKIVSNTAYKSETVPRLWDIVLEDGRTVSMFDVRLYAKAEDMA